ncbi:MAG: hypothetical protein AAFQ22_13615 [Pseudomonadota bacterium]
MYLTDKEDALAADMIAKGWHLAGGITPSPDRFHVMGERSSGTNYAQWALERTTQLRDVDYHWLTAKPVSSRLSKLPGIAFKQPSIGRYGWKHGVPSFPAIGRRDLIVVLFRDVFEWLVSMYAKPWHINDEMLSLNFSDFIRAPWDARVDRPTRYFDLPNVDDWNSLPLRLDRHPITGRCYVNILEMRSVKTQAYLGLEHLGGNVAFVRHERFVADTQTCLDEMSSHYSFDLSGQTAETTERLGSEWKNDSKSRYEEAKSAIESEKDYILSILDLHVEKRIGFDYS